MPLHKDEAKIIHAFILLHMHNLPINNIGRRCTMQLVTNNSIIDNFIIARIRNYQVTLSKTLLHAGWGLTETYIWLQYVRKQSVYSHRCQVKSLHYFLSHCGALSEKISCCSTWMRNSFVWTHINYNLKDTPQVSSNIYLHLMKNSCI